MLQNASAESISFSEINVLSDYLAYNKEKVFT